MTNPNDWHLELRAELAKLPDDFAAYCRDTGAKAAGAWTHADSDHLRGLEAWAHELATRDRRLGTAALVALAQAGFPMAMASANGSEADMGFRAEDTAMDGAPVETQIALGAAWLAAPSDATRTAVVASFDPSRQLNVWDDDLRPRSDDQAWFWYFDVGQCIAHAIIGEVGDPGADSYYTWTPAQSVARGLVLAARGVRAAGDDAAALEKLRSAVG